VSYVSHPANMTVKVVTSKLYGLEGEDKITYIILNGKLRWRWEEKSLG